MRIFQGKRGFQVPGGLVLSLRPRAEKLSRLAGGQFFQPDAKQPAAWDLQSHAIEYQDL